MKNNLFENLPDVLDAKLLAHALCISRSGAYALMSQPDFPTLQIGGRKLVTKPDLIEWISITESPFPAGAFLRRVQETIEKSLSATPALQLAQLFQNVQPQAAPQETSPEDDENFDAAMDFINSL